MLTTLNCEVTSVPATLSYDDYDDYEGVRTVRVYHHPHDGGENGMGCLLTDQTSQASSR